MGPSGQGLTKGVTAAVAALDLLQQAHRLVVEHRPRLWLVSCFYRVSREAQDVANTQGMGSQHVGLQGNAVAVAATDLKHRLQTVIQEQAADGQTAHPHHRAAAIGNVDAMHPTPQGFCCLQCLPGAATPWWSQFCGQHRLTGSDGLLKQ